MSKVDLVVMGGGPACSPAAALVAAQGRSGLIPVQDRRSRDCALLFARFPPRLTRLTAPRRAPWKRWHSITSKIVEQLLT